MPLEQAHLEQHVDPKIPHILKYMGSKREILEFVVQSINELDVKEGWLCDLFAGTSVVGASLKDKYNIHSNDIQSYSGILAQTYLTDLKSNVPFSVLDELKQEITLEVERFKSIYPELVFNYEKDLAVSEVVLLEKEQQKLIDKNFKIGFHLFTKYYSGTYWSFEQCVWIDAIRCVAERHKDTHIYKAIMCSLISSMSYVTQSTGHYAQYRDVNSRNMNDILIYRRRDIWIYFERKFLDLVTNLNGTNTKSSRITNLDYLDCLRLIENGSIVYADPPYQSVHYSRFYHALETLVRYDYPAVSHKGRYREDRHQSPFCKKTTVNEAFTSLFEAVNNKEAHLALSYSDTGMISLAKIIALATKVFKGNYTNKVLQKEHLHSTMGRSDERQQIVTEYIILFKRI